MAGQPEPFSRVERPFGSNDKVKPMRTVVVITSLRVLTWCCAVLLAVLSLLPAHDMVRTSLPGRVEHFIAYAGSAAIAMAGSGATRGAAQIIGGFGCTLEFRSASSTSLLVGIQRLGILRHRRLGVV